MAIEGHEGAGSSHRRRAALIAVLVVAIIVGAVATYRWAFDPDRQLGPAPTAVGTECGLGRGGGGGAILALDGRTGALRWSRLVDNDDEWARGITAAAGTVAIVTSKDRTMGLSASDGSHRWCGEGTVVSSVDDRMFTIQGKTTVELDPKRGTSQPVAPDVLPNLLEDAADRISVRNDPNLIQDAPGKKPLQSVTLMATDRRAGTTLWSKRVPGYEFVTTKDLVIVNDQTSGTFILSSDAPPKTATVTAYRLATGEQSWSVRMPTIESLFLVGDTLIMGGSGRHGIMARDARTGRLLWDESHDSPGRTVGNSGDAYAVGAAIDDASGTVFLLVRPMQTSG